MDNIKDILFNNITKEDFEEYQAVRESGDTNMFDIKVVAMLSGLDYKQVITIMENYSELIAKFN